MRLVRLCWVILNVRSGHTSYTLLSDKEGQILAVAIYLCMLYLSDSTRAVIG